MSTARGVHTATQKVSSPAAGQGGCHYRSVREGSPRRGVECRVVPCAQRWQTDTGDAEGTMLPRCAAATTARLTARHCSSKPPPLKKEPAVRSSTAPTWSLRIGHRDRAKYQFSVLKLRKIQNFFPRARIHGTSSTTSAQIWQTPPGLAHWSVGTNGRSGASLACG